MPMRVVHIRNVRVAVLQASMTMPVRVWFARWIGQSMFVLVMCVVHVRMRMFQRLVLVFMLVVLSEMQPDADGHQQSCNSEL